MSPDYPVDPASFGSLDYLAIIVALIILFTPLVSRWLKKENHS